MLKVIVVILAVQNLILLLRIDNVAKWTKNNSSFIYTIAKILQKEGFGIEDES